jgi:hypothetical protein
VRWKEFVTTGAGAGDFFQIFRILMALASLERRLDLFLPLSYTLSVTARLLTTALLALDACPIPLPRQPP